MHLAVGPYELEVVQLLMNSAADITGMNNKGETAFDLALYHNLGVIECWGRGVIARRMDRV
jgi:hypothetical protein